MLHLILQRLNLLRLFLNLIRDDFDGLFLFFFDHHGGLLHLDVGLGGVLADRLLHVLQLVAVVEFVAFVGEDLALKQADAVGVEGYIIFSPFNGDINRSLRHPLTHIGKYLLPQHPHPPLNVPQMLLKAFDPLLTPPNPVLLGLEHPAQLRELDLHRDHTELLILKDLLHGRRVDIGLFVLADDHRPLQVPGVDLSFHLAVLF